MGLTTLERTMEEFFQTMEPDEGGPGDAWNQSEEHDKSAGVKYVDPQNIGKYKVGIGDTVQWQNPRGGTVLVDSAALHAYYRNKWRDPGRTKPKRQVGLAMSEGMTMEMGKEWGKALIWVVSTDGSVYSSMPKINRFHHSSFTAGDDVRSAGMWIVEKGIIRKMAPLSGHYKPDFGQFLAGVMTLKSAIKASRTSLFLYSTNDKVFKDVPYNVWSKMPFKELDENYRVHRDSSSLYYTLQLRANFFGSNLSMSGSFNGSLSGSGTW